MQALVVVPPSSQTSLLLLVAAGATALTVACNTRGTSEKQQAATAAADARVLTAPAVRITPAVVAAVIDAGLPAAPVADAGPPVDPVVEKLVVEELTTLAEAFCACKTMECAKQLDPRVEALLQKFGALQNSAAIRQAAETFRRRASVCMKALRDPAAGPGTDVEVEVEVEHPAVAAATRAADAVCACADRDCVRVALHDAAALADVGQDKGAKASPADERQIMAATQRMTECMNKLRPAPTP